MQEVISKNIQDLPAAAQQLLDYAGKRNIFCFSGQLGAGKTTFIKALCEHLGVREEVTSPTYSLINEYTYADADGSETLMYHMDLYRLNRPEEAFDIGLEDYLEGENYVLIEWYKIIENWLPPNAVRIKIELMPDSSRKMIFL